MLPLPCLKKRLLEFRLWNNRLAEYIDEEFADDGAAIGEQASSKSMAGSERRRRRKRSTRTLRKLLHSMDVDRLQSLWKAVRTGGSILSECVSVDSSTDGIRCHIDPAVVFYRAFLRPNLNAEEIGRRRMPLPWCRLFEADLDDCSMSTRNRSELLVCCNPYHYALLNSEKCFNEADQRRRKLTTVISTDNIKEVRDDVYRRLLETEDFATSSGSGGALSFMETDSIQSLSPSRDCSLNLNAVTEVCTPVRNESCQGEPPWCHMAYWEESVRLGALVAVRGRAAFVYLSMPQEKHETGARQSSLRHCDLCIGLLEREDGQLPPEVVRRTRQKIGRGFVMFRRRDEVWLYNRSDQCLFVRSNSMAPDGDRPWRLLPGCCCLIYRFLDAGDRRRAVGRPKDGGPAEPPTTLISFVKGWGNSYVRTFVTCCPCWVQVIFSA